MKNKSVSSLAWLPATPTVQRIEPDAVHVWVAHMGEDPALVNWAWEILDPEERKRAARFAFEFHRRRFILSHGFVRDVLARYLGVAPGRIEFRIDGFGKPHIVGGALEFNLSHSGRLAVVAASNGRKTGVDIEEIRQMPDLDAIAHRFFSESERTLLAAATETERINVFFACWTRKEAYIKAVGGGLSIPLNSFDTSPAGSSSEFWLSDLPPIDGYAGAIAVEGPPALLTCWQWKPHG